MVVPVLLLLPAHPTPGILMTMLRVQAAARVRWAEHQLPLQVPGGWHGSYHDGTQCPGETRRRGKGARRWRRPSSRATEGAPTPRQRGACYCQWAARVQVSVPLSSHGSSSSSNGCGGWQRGSSLGVRCDLKQGLRAALRAGAGCGGGVRGRQGGCLRSLRGADQRGRNRPLAVSGREGQRGAWSLRPY